MAAFDRSKEEDVDDEVDETSEAEGVEAIELPEPPMSASSSAPSEGALTFRSAQPDKQLSPHFKLSEFHCRDGSPVPTASVDGLTRLCVDVLEPLREKFGVCKVSSGFRSEAHNKKVNGAARSYHRYDLRPGFAAADLTFKTGSPAQWFQEADRVLGNSGGAGRYKTFVHVDNREGRWRG